MASQQKVLQALADQTSPISQQGLVEILKEKQGGFKSQLDLFLKREWATVNEDKEWTITDTGRGQLENLSNQQDDPELVNIEAANLAPYNQFIADGKAAGVTGSEAFFHAVADVVFRGGDYRDLKWVENTLAGMNIRPDAAQRWLLFWSAKTFVQKPAMPLGQTIKEAAMTPEQKEKQKEAEIRDYILDENDNPIKVGDLAGQMTYKDAMELSKIRGLNKAKASASGGNGANNKPISEQITEMITAVDALRGNQAPPKNYMVKPGPDGNYVVETVEAGAPMVIPQAPQPAPQKKEIYVVQNGQLTKLEDGMPIMISPPTPPAPAPAKKYMVNQETGVMEEIVGDKPIVIVRQSPVQPSVPLAAAASLTIPGTNGQPAQTVNMEQLDLYFKVNDWQIKNKREEESYRTKTEIANSFKDLLGKAARVAERMANKGAASEEEPGMDAPGPAAPVQNIPAAAGVPK
jgi:hypothetical protein